MEAHNRNERHHRLVILGLVILLAVGLWQCYAP
jgi:hypothetical protein